MSAPFDPVMLREKMIEREVIARGVRDRGVIDAMRAIPRHLFVDEALAARAYSDQPLPIGARQTISRPSTVAIMTELLQVESVHRVLEIGTGSGYQAAVLACLARHVDTVERHASLARRARRVLESLGIRNVTVHEKDGSVGLGRRTFPRILVTAGSPDLPDRLFEQLEEGGRMIVPVGENSGEERLHVVTRVEGRKIVERSVACSFVPLIGAEGHASAPDPPTWG